MRILCYTICKKRSNRINLGGYDALAEFQIPDPEQNDVLGFIESLKNEIVEA